MRENFLIDKQITFNNSDCLTKQVTVYNTDIPSDVYGKKTIQSGDILYKDITNKVKILKRYNPVSNTVNGSNVGTLTLKNVTGINIGDKLDFLYEALLVTFSLNAETITFKLGDLEFDFVASGTSLDTTVENFVTAYNQNKSFVGGYSVNIVGTGQVLIINKSGGFDDSFDPATNITVVEFKGIYSNSTPSNYGVVTAVNPSSKTVTYTASDDLANTNLSNISVQLTGLNENIKEVLGISTKTYDVTKITTKLIPLLTSSRGVYKSRIAYYDEDLTKLFPKMEFI